VDAYGADELSAGAAERSFFVAIRRALRPGGTSRVWFRVRRRTTALRRMPIFRPGPAGRLHEPRARRRILLLSVSRSTRPATISAAGFTAELLECNVSP